MYTPRPDPPYMRRTSSSAQNAVLGSSSAANRLLARTEDKGSKLSDVTEVDDRYTQLNTEINKLRAKLADRDAKLAAQTAKASLNVELERKLEHLVDKYRSSKTKHEQELASARKAHSEVQSEVEILRHQVKKGDVAAADAVKTLARVTREATEARLQNEDLVKKLNLSKPDVKLAEELATKLETAETQVDHLRREQVESTKEIQTLKTKLNAALSDLRSAQAQRTATADRTNQDAQTKDLGVAEAESEDLRKRLAASQQEHSTVQTLHDELAQELESTTQELETTRALLQAAAISNSILHRSSIPKVQFQQNERELARCRVANVDLESRVQSLRAEVEWVNEQMRDVQTALHEARERAQEAEEVSRQILQVRAEAVPRALEDDLDRDVLQIALERMQWNDSLLVEVRKEASYATRALDEVTESRSALLAALREANSHLTVEVGRRHEDEVRLAEAIASQSLAQEKVKIAEEAAKSDRTSLDRVQESAARWKVAEVALEEEIEGLRNSLTRAMRYEEAYAELEGSYRALLSCQAETEGEAERLGQLNSELRGLGGSDRISYVETVRRESAAVKQELAATRSLLNTAHERIAALHDEIDSYKAVGSDDVPKRIRVVRRLPEDGRLGTSVLSKSVAK